MGLRCCRNQINAIALPFTDYWRKFCLVIKLSLSMCIQHLNGGVTRKQLSQWKWLLSLNWNVLSLEALIHIVAPRICTLSVIALFVQNLIIAPSNSIYSIRPTHKTLQELLRYSKRMLRGLLWLEDWPQSVLPHAFPQAKATSVQEMTSLRSTVFWDVVLMPWSLFESQRATVDNRTVLFHWLRGPSIPHPVQMQDSVTI